MQKIVIATEEEANEVLKTLLKLHKRYGFATMGDYLELVGLPFTYADEKIGWTELNDIPIKTVEGGFALELPETKSLPQAPTSTFPFLKGWWVVVDVPDDQTYEGWLIDEMGGTMIIKIEPSEIHLGVQLKTIKKIDAYRERPS